MKIEEDRELDPEQPLIHPGEILQYHFLEPLELPVTELARDLGESMETIENLLAGSQGITHLLALKLGTYFGNLPTFWLSLQAHHDMLLCLKKAETQQELASVPPRFNRSINSIDNIIFPGNEE